MGNGAHTGGLACLHASPGGSSAPAPHPHGSPCSATAVTLVLRWWQGHVGEHPGTSIGHKPHSTLGRGLVAALPTLGLQSCGSRGSDSVEASPPPLTKSMKVIISWGHLSPTGCGNRLLGTGDWLLHPSQDNIFILLWALPVMKPAMSASHT